MLEGAEVRLAVDIGGTFTDIVLDVGAAIADAQAADDAAAARGGGARRRAARSWPMRGRAYRRHRRLRARHDAGDQRHHRAARRASTALIATEGFRDVLDIGNESRYDQYDLTIDKPKPLVPRALRFTVPERIDVHGEVRLPLDEAAVRALAPELRAAGRRERRRRLPALLRQSRARAAHARDPAARRCPASRVTAVVARSVRRSANTSAPRRRWPTPMCSR